MTVSANVIPSRAPSLITASPLEKGEISFVTEDLTKNFGATGVIADGSYTLSTGGDGDGAQAGKYKVTIKSKEDYLAKAQADFQKVREKTIRNSLPISRRKPKRKPRA